METSTIYQILQWAFGGTTFISVVGMVAYWRQTKRTKEAETRLTEIQAQQAKYDYEQKRIEDLHKVVDLLNTQLLAAQKLAAQKEEIITDKTNRIREKDEVISNLMAKLMQREQYISAQQRFIDWLKNWHCKREYGNGEEDCRRREPEQRVKVSYDPPPELEECDLPVIPADAESDKT